MKMLDTLKCSIPILAPNLDELFGSKLLADRIRVLLHNIYICYQFANVKNMEDSFFYEQGWVTIPAKRLESLLTNKYNEILDFAESNLLIETLRNDNGNKRYLKGEWCTPYRINPTFLPEEGKRFRVENITSYKVIKAVHRYNSKQDLINEYADTYEYYNGLNKMLDSFSFDTKLFDELEAGKILLKKKKGQTTEERIRNITEASMVAEFVNDKQKFRTTVCKFGERFHSVFTRLPSEFRPYLRINGLEEEIWMLDICNSQVYCLALILAHPEKLLDLLPEFTTVLKRFINCSGSDRRFFMEQCSSGNIYDLWKEFRNQKSRDEAKDELIKGILFERPMIRKKFYKSAREYFMFLFPDVWHSILAIKKITEDELPFIKEIYLDNHKHYDELALHKNVSLMCQRLESRLLLGNIAQKLLCDDSIKPFLTIHDSILFAESDFDKIKNAFRQCFQSLRLPPPTLKLTKYPTETKSIIRL